MGAIATFLNGRAYKQDELLTSGKYKVLRVGNFYTNDRWYYSDLELADKFYADKGDLLYTWSASFGPHIWLGDKVIYHYHIWKVVLSEYILKDFALQILEKDKQNILSHPNGSTMIHVTKVDMENKQICIPCLAEQQKIGNFFKYLDETITLHQRKLESMKLLKKSLLQKMFPKSGETVPEVRFPGFTDAWEQRKLDKIANRYDNLRIPVTASDRISGTTPYYGANGIQDYVKGFTHDGEFVLIAEDGANDLHNYPVQYVNGKVWVNNHAHVLQGINGLVDTRFLGYAFSQVNMEAILVGGSRAKLNASDLMKIEIRLPRLMQEQQHIATFLHSLDQTITLHQRKVEALQKLKKSLLQQMFV